MMRPDPFAAPEAVGIAIFALATLVLVGLMLALERKARRGEWRHETTRRVAHVLACLYAIVSHDALPLWLFVLACSLFALALVVSRRMKALTSVHTTRRASLGEIYLPVGIIIAALAGLLPWPEPGAIPYTLVSRGPDVFLATILILALADVAAGVTGDLLRAESKTRLGSLAFFGVSILVVQACGFSTLLSLAVAVVATLVERVSSRGTDNLTVPLAAGLMLALLPL
jgi:phytol kinase